jgi:5'-deoxynucleotidase YfbR-like HD superfamily hydrolase
MFSVAHDMSAVQRFSRIRMVHPENVLTHTGMVCLFAYSIGSLLRTKAHRELRPLDLGAIMARAVAHDIDETITGDIVRPTKYFSAIIRQELAGLEAKGVDNVANALDLPVLVTDFETAKLGREGYVVKMADLLAALCTVFIEVMVCGNRAMVQPARNMRHVLVKLRPADSGKWTAEERSIIDDLLDEAHCLLEEVIQCAPPLVSVHGDV